MQSKYDISTFSLSTRTIVQSEYEIRDRVAFSLGTRLAAVRSFSLSTMSGTAVSLRITYGQLVTSQRITLNCIATHFRA